MNSSLYPGSPYTTRTTLTNVPPTGTGSGRTAERMEYVPPSAFQIGREPQNNVPVIPRGYTGKPEI